MEQAQDGICDHWPDGSMRYQWLKALVDSNRPTVKELHEIAIENGASMSLSNFRRYMNAHVTHWKEEQGGRLVTVYNKDSLKGFIEYPGRELTPIEVFKNKEGLRTMVEVAQLLKVTKDVVFWENKLSKVSEELQTLMAGGSLERKPNWLNRERKGRRLRLKAVAKYMGIADNILTWEEHKKEPSAEIITEWIWCKKRLIHE